MSIFILESNSTGSGEGGGGTLVLTKGNPGPHVFVFFVHSQVIQWTRGSMTMGVVGGTPTQWTHFVHLKNRYTYQVKISTYSTVGNHYILIIEFFCLVSRIVSQVWDVVHIGSFVPCSARLVCHWAVRPSVRSLRNHCLHTVTLL